MGYFRALESASSKAEQIRAEGRTQLGLDLPFPDEATELLKELDGATLADKAQYYLGLSERERYKLLASRWKLEGTLADYHDSILEAIAQDICIAHLAELKQQVRAFTKLVRTFKP